MQHSQRSPDYSEEVSAQLDAASAMHRDVMAAARLQALKLELNGVAMFAAARGAVIRARLQEAGVDVEQLGQQLTEAVQITEPEQRKRRLQEISAATSPLLERIREVW